LLREESFDSLPPRQSILDVRRISSVLKAYIIYYKYKCPGEKKPGAVKQYRLYANSLEEARSLASQQGNYKDVEILRVKPA